MLQPRKAYHRISSFQDERLEPYASTSPRDVGISPPAIALQELDTVTTNYDPLQPLVDQVTNDRPSFKGPRFPKLTGWRVGAAVAFTTASTALIINVSVGIWALTSKDKSSRNVLIEIFSGDCNRVSSLNVWAHLAINALSTMLLSGSNYCMQCLVAPTRDDINRAHAKRKWLDIGTPSVRNLRQVGTTKAVLWWALGLSSVPLHLMFNSAFYTSIATNDYNVAFVTENFTTGAAFSTANGANSANWQPPGWTPKLMQANISSLERLDNKACIQAYAVDIVSDRRTLLVISSNASTRGDGSVLGSANYEYQTPARNAELQQGYDPYTWVCSDLTNQNMGYTPPINSDDDEQENCYKYVPKIIDHAEDWAPNNWNAEYCLSEKILGHCTFNINLVIILIVVICNVGKVIVMATVAFSPRLGRPLMTIGDAVSSFTEVPDESTKQMCLASRSEFVPLQLEIPGLTPKAQWGPTSPKTWEPVTHRLYDAATKKRWWTCVLLFSGAIIVILALLGDALGAINGSSVASLGFGQLHSQAMITGWAIASITNADAAVIANVLVANSPQAILSFLYLSLNGLCTSMFLAKEWSLFAIQRKTLRVSQVQGDQRKSYFLQLPYRIGLPLMFISGLLHWLVSQSIFLAVIAEYDELGNLKDPMVVSTCGFSPLAMIWSMVAGAVIIIGLVVISRQRLDGRIPLVGSCSAAISAACHRAAWEGEGASVKALQWGAVSDAASGDGVGHCCFSTGSVGVPESGKLYA